MSESIESSSDESTQSQEQPTCTAMCSTSLSNRGLPISMAMLYTADDGPSDHMDIETPPTSPETPPISPECGHSHIDRTKATEWIKHVSMESNQSCVSEPMKTPVDSGKRRRSKNFVAGGLAERMQKIIQRENSEITFWEHHSARQHETGNVFTAVLMCQLSNHTKCSSYSVCHFVVIIWFVYWFSGFFTGYLQKLRFSLSYRG